MQSVKPPVDAPISIQIQPFRSIGNEASAFSSLSPPRLTYFKLLPLTSISASSKNVLPALSSRCPATKTLPSMIIIFAFSLEGASPFFTRRTSSLSFIGPPLFSHKQSPHLFRIPSVMKAHRHGTHTHQEGRY